MKSQKTEELILSTKSKPEEKLKRKERQRPHSLEISSSNLNPSNQEVKKKQIPRPRPHSLETAPSGLDLTVPMMGVIYAANPKKVNPKYCRYLLSSDLTKYQPGYNMGQMPDGLYVFIKTTTSISIKTDKGYYFPPGTIICREKANISENSAHNYLTLEVKLKPENISAAGLILLKNNVVEEWNLRTGTYCGPCKLDNPKAYEGIGLPWGPYNSDGQNGKDSPKATRRMRKRCYQSHEDLPRSLREEPPTESSSPQRSASTSAVIETLRSRSQITPTGTTPKRSAIPISTSVESLPSKEDRESTPRAHTTPKTPKIPTGSSFPLGASFRTFGSTASFPSEKELSRSMASITPSSDATAPPTLQQENSEESSSDASELSSNASKSYTFS